MVEGIRVGSVQSMAAVREQKAAVRASGGAACRDQALLETGVGAARCHTDSEVA
jgi:hypothetical protein